MKISVITVCYNCAETLQDTLQSVANQTWPNIEHIFIDGASSDCSLSIAKQYKDTISVFVSEPDKGIYDAMNKGISLATGQIIGILNSDDFYVHDHVLENVANCFLSDGSLEACYSDLTYVRAKEPGKIVRYWVSNQYRSGLFNRGWVPPHPTFYVKSSVYDQYGVFDLSFKIASDYELMLRLLCVNKIKSRYINDVWIRMRMGGESNRNIVNVWNQNAEVLRALSKHNIVLHPVLFFIRKFFLKLFQFIHRPVK